MWTKLWDLFGPEEAERGKHFRHLFMRSLWLPRVSQRPSHLSILPVCQFATSVRLPSEKINRGSDTKGFPQPQLPESDAPSLRLGRLDDKLDASLDTRANRESRVSDNPGTSPRDNDV